MGLFSKSQEEKDKEEFDNKIKEAGGMSQAVSPENYEKLVIAQNELMIGLLTVIATGTGLVGQAAVTLHSGIYHNSVKKLIK